jgi:hypothetical protein
MDADMFPAVVFLKHLLGIPLCKACSGIGRSGLFDFLGFVMYGWVPIQSWTDVKPWFAVDCRVQPPIRIGNFCSDVADDRSRRSIFARIR